MIVIGTLEQLVVKLLGTIRPRQTVLDPVPTIAVLAESNTLSVERRAS